MEDVIVVVVVVVVVAAAADNVALRVVDAVVDIQSKNDHSVDYWQARRAARAGIAVVFFLYYHLLFEASYLESY